MKHNFPTMGEDESNTRKRKPLTQLTLTSDITAAKKKRPAPTNCERRAGTINRVILKNFMCHSYLDVDLTTNINIIIGRNGSGKSAILTALIVGLGGKASLTNRGNSIKGFVKAGKTSGSIEIHLHNGGPMAYHPKIYGDQITVFRNFTASGSSSYKIKGDAGQVVATSVREIQNITSSLNIQVDNPICILNQDTARNFLSSNNPTHKFGLFIKATKLEALAEEYKKVKLNKREATNIFEDKQKNFQKLQNDLKNVKRKIEHKRSVANIKEKLQLVQREMLWAKVRDAEEKVQKDEDKIAELERNYNTVIDNCTNRKERIGNLTKSIKNLEQQAGELKETIQVQSRPQLDVRRVIEDLMQKYIDKKREKQLIINTIETKTKDSDVLKRQINFTKENLSRAEQEKASRLRDLTKKADQIKSMEDYSQTCKNDLYQIRNDVKRREEERHDLRREISQVEHHMRNDRSSLDALKNESGNTLLLYGREMPRVKQLIEMNKNKFSHLPRGPLGHYIKLKDKKWAVAAESFMQPMLGSFVVDNKKDAQLLMSIFNQAEVSKKPPIITSKFFNKKHNVEDNLVHAPKDCISLYNALDMNDPIVSNGIVDQLSIEGILLIPDNERAIELMSNAPNVPLNCKQGITMTGERFYPDPNYRTYGSRYNRAVYLQVDTKERIVQLEQNLIESAKKKENLEKQCQAIAQEIRDQDEKIRQLEENITKINTAKSKIREQLQELKATAEPEVVNIDILENELAELHKVIEEKNSQLAQTEESIKEIKMEIRNNEEQSQQLMESITSLEERLSSLEKQIAEETIRQREIATSEEFDKRKLTEVERKLEEARAELASKKATVGRFTEQASTVGERQETLRKVADISNEISQLERSVQQKESNTENLDDLHQKYRDMKNKITNASTLISCLNDDIKELNKAIDMRSKHYKLTESYFITFIKHSFKRIMEVRQFQGSIEINMQEKKLELHVKPQRGSQGLTTTSNLSGGERSFSTVAFLYSLWQCMDFPFYFLDEFDVYMDKLNRTKVIEILLHHAATHSDLQFVFLTPQDVSFIKKDVAILRLADPERNPV